jgi:hypothetical protein
VETLISQTYLFNGHLHAKVTPCHHDAVSDLQDLVKVLYTLAVFYLGDDLDLKGRSEVQLEGQQDVRCILTLSLPCPFRQLKQRLESKAFHKNLSIQSVFDLVMHCHLIMNKGLARTL